MINQNINEAFVSSQFVAIREMRIRNKITFIFISFLSLIQSIIGVIQSKRSTKFAVIIEALHRYKDIQGHLLVPQSYVIPEINCYPNNLWGLRLGDRVKAIRQAASYSSLEYSSVLDRMGFEWDYYSAKRKHELQILIELIKVYNLHIKNISFIKSSWKIPRCLQFVTIILCHQCYYFFLQSGTILGRKKCGE